MKSLISHFEVASDNFLKNIEELMETNNKNVIDVREMAKFYAVDMISKYVFAVDVNSFKQYQKDSEFAKLALKVGEVNLSLSFIINSILLPRAVTDWLKFNIFNVEPLDKLGDLFKKMIRERDPNLRYNDLVEMLQDSINKNKVQMSEDEMVANSLLTFFAGTFRNLI